MILTLTNGEKYEAAAMFSDQRAIVIMDGAYVMVDRFDPDTWELSGEPARQGLELATLNALVKGLGDGTTVIVTRNGDT